MQNPLPSMASVFWFGVLLFISGGAAFGIKAPLLGHLMFWPGLVFMTLGALGIILGLIAWSFRSRDE